jgi:hypothetical protein
MSGVGATATKVYEISEATVDVFRITNPASENTSASLGTGYTVTVNAPATAQVLFASTIGTWGNNSNVQVVPVDGGLASAVLTSNIAGTATVSASDYAAPTTNDSVTISFSAAASTAAKISLQASATVMATTVSSESPQEVQLVSTVRNASDQVVGGAPVSFKIDNPTGGGEFINPPIAYTNDQGQAKSTFTSGVLTSPAVSLTAALVDKPAVTSSLEITIGGEAGSITLGRATEITALSSTAYKLPMSAQVSDGKGGPAANVQVSLTVWPEQYLACDGEWYDNEDEDEDLNLDQQVLGAEIVTEDTNGDGQLTPPASIAGSMVPSPPITTDENGLANFDLIYLKANYGTYVRVKATATVSGTETSSTMKFYLPILESDESKVPAPTLLPPSGQCLDEAEE